MNFENRRQTNLEEQQYNSALNEAIDLINEQHKRKQQQAEERREERQLISTGQRHKIIQKPENQLEKQSEANNQKRLKQLAEVLGRDTMIYLKDIQLENTREETRNLTREELQREVDQYSRLIS